MPDRSPSPFSPTRRPCAAAVCSSLLIVGAFALATPAAALPRADTPAEPLPATAEPGSAVDPVCEPSDATATLLDLTDRISQDCGFTRECLERQAAILEPAFESQPDDFHLARALQDLWHPFLPLAQEDPEGRTKWVERFHRRAEEHPDDAVALYLYGRALADPKRALEVFQQAVAADPELPWAHLGVAGMVVRGRNGEGPPDTGLLQREIGAFLDRCPARLATAAQFLDRIPDKQFWHAHAERGRAAIEQLSPERALKRYPALWQILYAGTPLEDHDRVDPQVRADLERIEALGLDDREDWWAARTEGYEMLGDDEALERVENAHLETSPCAQEAVFGRFKRWSEEHPEASGQASAAEKSAHSRQLWEATGEWVATCPDALLYWQLRMSAAADLDDLSDDEVLAAVDRFRELAEQTGSQGSSPIELNIARLYAHRGVRLDQVRPLAEEGLAKGLEETRKTLENPGVPEDIKKLLADNEPYYRFQALQASTEAAIGLERPEEARELLLDLRALADEMRPGDDDEARRRRLFETIDGTYWDLRADLATLESNGMDAAVFRARTAAYLPDDADEKREEAHSAWLDAGGSEESWQAVLEGFRAGSGPATDRNAVLWDEQELPLPQFELADLSGGTWHRADLEGKTVFANVWATWCGPCRQELPLVEQLHQQLADRDDVAVVTLNIDTNPSLAVHFMEKEGYTFPVLQAGALINEIGKGGAVPRSWILDPSVVLRREQIGFGNEEGWVDGVIDVLEEVGGGEPAADPSDGP